MLIGIPVESRAAERRVALTPDTVRTLAAQGHGFMVESGAGAPAGFRDVDYVEAGARVGDRPEAFAADVVAVISPPDNTADLMRPGSVLIGFLQPFERVDLMKRLATNGVTAMAFEFLPRTTLAQSMDALSSQASLAGYQAVLLAADRLGRILPMMTTAAGTIRPASTLILGAGVAGLQAIATAKRLGSIVSAFDVREVVAEQVQSLGGKFIKLDLAAEGSAEGGYAKALAGDDQERLIRGLQPHVAASHLVVTTAQVPGRPAPILIDDATLDACRPGTVIVDMAAPTGGNTTATVLGEDVERNGVLILGPQDLAARVATDASTLYGRNIAALLGHLVTDGDLVLDFSDEITDGVVVTHDGTIRSERVAALVPTPGSPA